MWILTHFAPTHPKGVWQLREGGVASFPQANPKRKCMNPSKNAPELLTRLRIFLMQEKISSENWGYQKCAWPGSKLWEHVPWDSLAQLSTTEPATVTAEFMENLLIHAITLLMCIVADCNECPLYANKCNKGRDAKP